MTDLLSTSAALIPSAERFTEEERQGLRDRLRSSRTKSTWRQYESAWRHFDAWCTSREIDPTIASAEAVAVYLNELAKTHGGGTVTNYKSALSAAYNLMGRVPSPTWDPRVKSVLKAIRAEYGIRAKRPRTAATAEIMAALVNAIDKGQDKSKPSLKTLRDRALVLLGYMGAFRQSALTALLWSDLDRRPTGYAVTVRRDKTDQAGAGMVKWIPIGDGGPLDAVVAVDAWRGAFLFAAPTEPVFPRLVLRARRRYLIAPRALAGKAVGVIIKLLGVAAGYPAEAVSLLGGHSLRAGFVTEALNRGATVEQVQTQTGHTSVDMVLRYRRNNAPHIGNAANVLVSTTTTSTKPEG